MKTLLLVLASCTMAMADGSSCTIKDVNGTYAFEANGSLLVPNTPITGPFSRIGSFVADGKGNIHFSTLALYNGINFGVENFAGTYAVTSDCAIDLHVAVPAPVFANAEFKGQVALNGNDITFMLINTSDPTKPGISTIVGFGRKRLAPVGIFASSCSIRDLAGNWRLELNGFHNLPPFGTGTPYRLVSRLQLDGSGHLLTSLITSDNGTIIPATGAGTYVVNADCSFDLSYTIGSTPNGVRGSIIDFFNTFAALNMPGPTQPGVGIITGAVATGTMVRELSLP